MNKNLLLASALTVSIASTVSAGDAFDMPVSGELLPGWIQSDGTRVAGLRLKLAPGWKTYWRSPGDAGIPPEFNWSGSRNLAGVGITWPAPVVFMTAGMRTIGYTGDVVLPLALAAQKPDAPISVKVSIDLGICSDICIPHRMTLEGVIDDDNRTPTPAIAAALAARPYSASDAGVTEATCALSPTQDGLEITMMLYMPSAGGNETVIIEPGSQGLWMSDTLTQRDGETLTAVGEMMTSDGSPVAITRSDVKITVLGANYAVEIDGCSPG